MEVISEGMYLERSGDSAVAHVNSRGRLVALEFFCEAFVFLRGSCEFRK